MQRLIFLLIVSCGFSFPSAALSAEPAPSLKYVPADVGMYMAFLRNREQVDLIAGSNWWKNVQANDTGRKLIESLKEAWEGPDGPGAQVRSLLEDPANKELLELGVEAGSDEVFIYADKAFIDIYNTYYHATQAMQFKMFGLMAQGDLFSPDFQTKPAEAALDVLVANEAKLKVPRVVIAGKIKSTDKAAKQLARMAAVRELLPALRPELRGKLNEVKVGDSSFYTLEATLAEALPLEDLGLDGLTTEEKYHAVINRLKEKKFALSIGIHKGYIVVALGPSNEHLAQWGQGKRLADLPAMAPLNKFSDKKVTLVAYAAPELMAMSSYVEKAKLDNYARWGKEIVAGTELEADAKAGIVADIDELHGDLVKYSPQFGPAASVGFLTEEGMESYGFDWTTPHAVDGSKKLRILQHVGGKPLFLITGRGASQNDTYPLLAKWTVKGHAYFERYAVPQMPEAEQRQYDAVMAKLTPLARRFDQTTRELLLPSLAQGQTAFVVDARLRSREWFKPLPTGMSIRLVQPSLVCSVSDADKLKSALREYHKLINDGLVQMRGTIPGMPEFLLPEPKSREFDAGEVTWWELPESLGFDQQLAPNYGVSPTTAAFSLAPKQSLALLEPTPLELGGLFADVDRPLAMATHIDVAGLAAAIQPWVEAVNAAGPGDDEVVKTYRDVAELLQVIHGVSSVSYEQDDALVSHSLIRVKDAK